MLAEITGYDAVSLQPNAGSQGEFAGLLAIRAYHRSRGDDQRTVCLIPSSRPRHQRGERGDGRHGGRGRGLRRRRQRRPRRPARQGRRRRRPARGDHGHLPVDPRRVRGGHHRALRDRPRRTAARCTSTAPTSTRSSAWPSPGAFGADVSHLNLHKTFCIPHGGGGPGVGPVGGARPPGAVPARPPARRADGAAGRPGGGGAVRVGRHPAHLVGLHRADGRRRAARARPPAAILNANYVARRLDAALPGALHRRARAASPTSASSTCGRSPRPPA